MHFENLREYTKDHKIGRGTERDNGFVFFDETDERAYFVPGKDKESVSAWATLGLDLYMMCSFLMDDVDLGKKDFLTYQNLCDMEMTGSKNHFEMILFFYLQKFPGKSLLDIVRESTTSDISYRDWVKKYGDALDKIRAPMI